MKTAHLPINRDPAIRFGKPCLVGTRIAVSDMLGWLASGMTLAEIVDDFPPLTQAHIEAAVTFAADEQAQLEG